VIALLLLIAMSKIGKHYAGGVARQAHLSDKDTRRGSRGPDLHMPHSGRHADIHAKT
jgi:hypothetical protein